MPSPLGIGGLSRIELKNSLDLAGVRLNVSAQTLLEDPVFDSDAARTVTTIEIMECSVADLGLDDGASLTQIFATAYKQGLTLCPPFAGPYLRLATPHQPTAPDSIMSNGQAPTGSVTIASRRLRAEYGYPRGSYLRVVDDQLWLRGYRCAEDAPWRPEDRFLFRTKHATAVTGNRAARKQHACVREPEPQAGQGVADPNGSCDDPCLRE